MSFPETFKFLMVLNLYGKGSVVTKATLLCMLLVVLFLDCENEWPCLKGLQKQCTYEKILYILCLSDVSVHI